MVRDKEAAMYELVMLTGKTGYIECPAKMGVFLCDPGKAVLIDAGSDKDAGKKALKVLDANGWQLSSTRTCTRITSAATNWSRTVPERLSTDRPPRRPWLRTRSWNRLCSSAAIRPSSCAASS